MEGRTGGKGWRGWVCGARLLIPAATLVIKRMVRVPVVRGSRRTCGIWNDARVPVLEAAGLDLG